MVEEDVDPQPHKQGVRCCLVFNLIFDFSLSSMCGYWPGAGGKGEQRGGTRLEKTRAESE